MPLQQRLLSMTAACRCQLKLAHRGCAWHAAPVPASPLWQTMRSAADPPGSAAAKVLCCRCCAALQVVRDHLPVFEVHKTPDGQEWVRRVAQPRQLQEPCRRWDPERCSGCKDGARCSYRHDLPELLWQPL